MADSVQEIDPLEISFSNDKGFEPSTPSEASPPSGKPDRQTGLSVKTPIEIFYPSRLQFCPKENVIPNRVETPKSRQTSKLYPQSLNKQQQFSRDKYLSMYESAYNSQRKKVDPREPLVEIPRYTKGYMGHSGLSGYRKSMNEERKERTKKWARVDAVDHLKDISRLNDLISRISTHVQVYGRLYPLKRR